MTDPTPQKLVLNEQPPCSQPSQQAAGGTQNSSAKDNMMTIDPSALLKAPYASTSSKPASSAPSSREPQCQAHVELLAFHGIKVRDFAYESKLPPVKPWYKPQIQPGVQSLKRTKTEEAEEPGSSSDSAPGEGGSVMKKARLERVTTEPDFESQETDFQSVTSVPIRARGFLDLQDFVPPELQQSQYHYDSQAINSPESQPPIPDFDSQDTEPYIDTPLVTPHGSLQFVVADASDVPASQLDFVESQAPLPNLLTYAAQRVKDPTGLTGSLSSMSSLSSSIFSAPSSSPPQPPKVPTPPISSSTSRRISPPQTREASPPAASSPPSIPYQLRKRPTTTKSIKQQQSKPPSRTKSSAPRSPSFLARGHSRLTHQKSLSPRQLRPLRRRIAS